MARSRLAILLAAAILHVLLSLCRADTNASKAPAKKPSSAPGKRQLTRSDGRRWDRLAEVIKDEIKSKSTKFLESRDKV